MSDPDNFICSERFKDVEKCWEDRDDDKLKELREAMKEKCGYVRESNEQDLDACIGLRGGRRRKKKSRRRRTKKKKRRRTKKKKRRRTKKKRKRRRRRSRRGGVGDGKKCTIEGWGTTGKRRGPRYECHPPPKAEGDPCYYVKGLIGNDCNTVARGVYTCLNGKCKKKNHA
tara:strand:+ start:31340 stop:31852 length:513 start_codon:yes stop_codon:yes gene_type:complete